MRKLNDYLYFNVEIVSKAMVDLEFTLFYFIQNACKICK